jgi:uncharacterized RDD family membrane protein YckC
MQIFSLKNNLKKRIIATILDYGLYFLFFFAYLIYFGHASKEGGQTVNGVMVLPLNIVWFIYFVVVESIYGGTPGHLAMNLKVLTIKGKDIDFIYSLKRHLLDPIDILLYGIPAYITIKNTPHHQRLGDLWAKTIVIDTSDPEQVSQPTEF